MTLASKPSGMRMPGGSGEVQRPGYETAATKIVEFITATGLKPGERLPTERALSEQLGVSRTVVREAIKVLSATGIVRSQQGSGLYVNSEPHPFATAVIDVSMTVDPRDVDSLFEFRLTLEIKTARLAAERITPKELRTLQEAVELHRQSAEMQDFEQFNEADATFHLTIAESTRNPFLASAVATVFRLQDWAIKVVTGGTPGSLQVAAKEHSAILAAISDGLPERAAQAMQSHIATVMASYQQAARRRLMGDGPLS